MNANNTKPDRYLAEVLFRSKKGRACTYRKIVDGDIDEVYENTVREIKKIEYFDKIDSVNIVKLQTLDK